MKDIGSKYSDFQPSPVIYKLYIEGCKMMQDFTLDKTRPDEQPGCFCELVPRQAIAV